MQPQPPKPSEPAREEVQQTKPEVQEVKSNEVYREPPVSEPDPQAGRVDRLEQQLRSLKVLGLAAALLAMLSLIGLAFMMQRGPGREAGMSGETLSIRDAKGMVRAWIGERDGQVQVELRDQAGRRRLGLGLGADEEPRLTFYHKDQKILGELIPLPDGQPGIKLLNQAGEAVAATPAPSPPPPAAPEPQAIAPLPASPLPEPPKESQKSEVGPSAAVAGEVFVASPGGKAYHRPTCSWVKNIPMNKLREFSSTAEAAKAGLHPCRRCRPDLPEPKD